MITAFHCITRAGQWYTKYTDQQSVPPAGFTGTDTCNLVYTTTHASMSEARSYTPSMLKLNKRQKERGL
jgi:predicted GIY-YIG superfamily endonuclease